jgi:hypothetical protein
MGIPETCTVTAVRRGVVYYTNSTGFRSKIGLVQLHTILGQWVGATAADDEVQTAPDEIIGSAAR